MLPRTRQYLVLPQPAARRLLPLWWRWIIANALGELVGLGFVAAIAGGVIWQFGEPRTVVAIVLFMVLMMLLGAGEGLLLGFAQWQAVHPFFRALKRREWMKATTLGAVIAWGLGMIPSTLLAWQETSSAGPPMPINETTKYFMAAALGLGLGLVLGVSQWIVLRRYLNHSSWWVAANAAAWAVGMPIVFFGAGTVPAQTSGWLLVLMMALTLLMAGAVVGAIHGCALVWFLQNRRSQKDSLI